MSHLFSTSIHSVEENKMGGERIRQPPVLCVLSGCTAPRHLFEQCESSFSHQPITSAMLDVEHSLSVSVKTSSVARAASSSRKSANCLLFRTVSWQSFQLEMLCNAGLGNYISHLPMHHVRDCKLGDISRPHSAAITKSTIALVDHNLSHLLF